MNTFDRAKAYADKLYSIREQIHRHPELGNQEYRTAELVEETLRALGIESISSTEMIANLIEEETLMGTVGVVTSLTHGNVVLSEIPVPHMSFHDNDEGISVYDIEMPENSIIAAVSTKDDVQVVGDDTVLFPGDTAIVVADRDQVPHVRTVFKNL